MRVLGHYLSNHVKQKLVLVTEEVREVPLDVEVFHERPFTESLTFYVRQGWNIVNPKTRVVPSEPREYFNDPRRSPCGGGPGPRVLLLPFTSLCTESSLYRHYTRSRRSRSTLYPVLSGASRYVCPTLRTYVTELMWSSVGHTPKTTIGYFSDMVRVDTRIGTTVLATRGG